MTLSSAYLKNMLFQIEKKVVIYIKRAFRLVRSVTRFLKPTEIGSLLNDPVNRGKIFLNVSVTFQLTRHYVEEQQILQLYSISSQIPSVSLGLLSV